MSKLNITLRNEGINLNEKEINQLESLITGKKRLVTKSWELMNSFLKSKGYNLNKRIIQDITANTLGIRNRNTLVALENKDSFPIKEWLKQHNISNDFLKFAYESWWSFQAEPRHKKRLDAVQPKQIQPSKNSLLKGFQSLNHKYTEAYNKKVEIPDHIPSYLISNEMKEKNIITPYLHKILSKKENDIVIDYTMFDLDLSLLDFQKVGNYYISLPKNLIHVFLGAHYAHNCMEGRALDYYTRIKSDIENFNNGLLSGYLDAHIIDDRTNSIVGIFALEEIFQIRAHGRAKRSLFVNNCNSTNRDMEIKLQNLITNIYGIKSSYSVDKGEEVKPLTNFSKNIQGYKSIDQALPREILSEYNYYFRKN